MHVSISQDVVNFWIVFSFLLKDIITYTRMWRHRECSICQPDISCKKNAHIICLLWVYKFSRLDCTCVAFVHGHCCNIHNSRWADLPCVCSHEVTPHVMWLTPVTNLLALLGTGLSSMQKKGLQYCWYHSTQCSGHMIVEAPVPSHGSWVISLFGLKYT